MSGDSELWREWLARRGPALVLFARQWTLSAADAEDAVQDGFVRFWKARERAKNRVAYLYACVRAAAIDLSRAQKSRRKREEAEATGAATAAFAPEQAELAAAVQTALGQLPAEQREVVVMKIWAGLTFAEIGQVLGISPNTAASRYRYAIERLEKLLSRSCVME